MSPQKPFKLRLPNTLHPESRQGLPYGARAGTRTRNNQGILGGAQTGSRDSNAAGLPQGTRKSSRTTASAGLLTGTEAPTGGGETKPWADPEYQGRDGDALVGERTGNATYPINLDEARQVFGSIADEINGAIQTREDAEYAEVPPWVIPSHRPATTSTVTSAANLLNTLNVGRPVLYVQNNIPYYGRLKTVTATTWTIQGAPMVVGTEFADHGFFIGYSGSIAQVNLRIAGLYGVGVTTTALQTVGGTFYSWGGSRARLVAFAARHVTNDATVQPKINILVGGSRVSTADGNLGIQPLAASWVWNPDVAIHTTNYIVETDDPIEVEVTAAGGTGDAADLSIALFVAYEKRAMSDILQLTNRVQE